MLPQAARWAHRTAGRPGQAPAARLPADAAAPAREPGMAAAHVTALLDETFGAEPG
jgi:hypothetical protein